jgi:hypothetical protein
MNRMPYLARFLVQCFERSKYYALVLLLLMNVATTHLFLLKPILNEVLKIDY